MIDVGSADGVLELSASGTPAAAGNPKASPKAYAASASQPGNRETGRSVQ